MTTYAEQAQRTYEQFRKDRLSTLAYNDVQVHKYDAYESLLLRISLPNTNFKCYLFILWIDRRSVSQAED